MLQHFFLTIKGQQAAILCPKSAQMTRGFNSHPTFPSFPHSPSHFQWRGACGWVFHSQFHFPFAPCPSRTASRAQEPSPNPFKLTVLLPLTVPASFALIGSSDWLFLFQVAPHQVPHCLCFAHCSHCLALSFCPWPDPHPHPSPVLSLVANC